MLNPGRLLLTVSPAMAIRPPSYETTSCGRDSARRTKPSSPPTRVALRICRTDFQSVRRGRIEIRPSRRTIELCCVLDLREPALPALLGRGVNLAGPSGYWVGHSSESFAVELLSDREPGLCARLPGIYFRSQRSEVRRVLGCLLTSAF